MYVVIISIDRHDRKRLDFHRDTIPASIDVVLRKIHQRLFRVCAMIAARSCQACILSSPERIYSTNQLLEALQSDFTGVKEQFQVYKLDLEAWMRVSLVIMLSIPFDHWLLGDSVFW